MSERVREIRERLGMSQREFSVTFGFNIWTIRNWEQGRREPMGAIESYLRVIAREPEAVRAALGR